MTFTKTNLAPKKDPVSDDALDWMWIVGLVLGVVAIVAGWICIYFSLSASLQNSEKNSEDTPYTVMEKRYNAIVSTYANDFIDTQLQDSSTFTENELYSYISPKMVYVGQNEVSRYIFEFTLPNGAIIQSDVPSIEGIRSQRLSRGECIQRYVMSMCSNIEDLLVANGYGLVATQDTID